MKDVRNRIILNAVANPISFFTLIGGITQMLIAFGAEWGVSAMFPGLIAVLLSLGYSGTLLALTDWDKAVEEHFAKVEAKKRIKRNHELDDLYEKLKRDDCRVNQKYLRDLRTLKEIFDEDKKSEKLSLYVSSELIEQVDRLFDSCIDRLKKDYQLYLRQKMVSKKLKAKIKKSREQNVEEVGKSVEEFSELVHGLHDVILDGFDLSVGRKNIESSVLAAQSLKDRLDNLKDPLSKYDDDDFEEWANRIPN